MKIFRILLTTFLVFHFRVKTSLTKTIKLYCQKKLRNNRRAKLVKKKFILSDENAIPFFYEYGMNNKEKMLES